MIVRKSVLNY